MGLLYFFKNPLPSSFKIKVICSAKRSMMIFGAI